MSSADELYLDHLIVAHSVLRTYSTDRVAANILKHAIPGRKLTIGEVTHLIRDAKELFGKLIMRDADFDRDRMRERLTANADRARVAGDFDAERKALIALMNLDEKFGNKKSDAPVIPELPNITFTTSEEDIEDAIIESTEEEYLD